VQFSGGRTRGHAQFVAKKPAQLVVRDQRLRGVASPGQGPHAQAAAAYVSSALTYSSSSPRRTDATQSSSSSGRNSRPDAKSVSCAPPRRDPRIGRPQRIDELPPGHRVVLMQHEVGEEQPTLPPRQLRLDAAAIHL